MGSVPDYRITPYPNPSRSQVHIRYNVPVAANVQVRVYDIVGRACRTLVTGRQRPGRYNLVWDQRDDRGRQLAAGVYFCRVEANGESRQRKMVVAR